MAILIKNSVVERNARELAALTGETLTDAVGAAVAERLEEARSKARRPRPTVAEMQRATDEFRRAVGLDKVKLNITRADFDALWELPGVQETDDPQ